MARDHRHQLRFACSARDQASRPVRVAWQSRLRPHTPTRRSRPHATGCSVDFARWIHRRSPFRSFLSQFIAWHPPLSLGADGLLGYPRLAACCSAASRSVQCVCAAPAYRGLGSPPHAPDARRIRRQALHLLLLGAEGDIDLQVRLEPLVFLYCVYRGPACLCRVCTCAKSKVRCLSV